MGKVTRSKAARKALESRVQLFLSLVTLNDKRLAGILNFGIRGFSQDTFLIRLDLAGFAVSAGSACSAGAARPSHVLTAMGLSSDEAKCAIRVSCGRATERAEILAFAERILEIAGQC